MEKRGGGGRGRYGRLSYALRLQNAEEYDRGNAIAGQKYADWVSGDGGHDGRQGRASIGTVLLRGVKDPMVIRAFNLKDLSQNLIVKRIEPCDLRRGENLRFTAIK